MSKFKETLIQTISSAKKHSDKAFILSTSLVDDFEDHEFQELLTAWYNSKDIKLITLATLVNGIFTEHKATFLISYRNLGDLIKNDRNIKRKTLSGTEYKEVWSYIIGNNCFRVVKKEEATLHRATVLELSMKELIEEFDKKVGAQFRQLQQKRCVEVFESYKSEFIGSNNNSNHPAIMESELKINKNRLDVKASDVRINKSHSKVILNSAGVVSPNDSIETNIAMVSTEEMVCLRELKREHDSNEISLTSFEVSFINGCLADLNKHMKRLSEKRRLKLEEIWIKTEGARIKIKKDQEEKSLIRFMQERPNDSLQEIEKEYIESFGETRYNLAIQTNNLETLKAVSKTIKLDEQAPINHSAVSSLNTAPTYVTPVPTGSNLNIEWDRADKLYRVAPGNVKNKIKDIYSNIEEADSDYERRAALDVFFKRYAEEQSKQNNFTSKGV